MKIQNKIRLNKAIPKVAQKGINFCVKNSPHILFGAGVVLTVGGAVLACKATLKTARELDDYRAEIEGAKNDLAHTDEYSKDLAYIYGKNALQVAVNYAPAVVVGSVGIACLTGSHVQLTKRNNALMAAYTALHTAYENYRDKVREEIGEEKELQFYHDTVMEHVVDDEGRTHEIVSSHDPEKMSPYARFFDEGSPHWQPEAEINFAWIECQQRYLNQLLRARGHVFLQEAYDALGIPRSSAAQAVGWIMNSDEGDSYIDFSLHHNRNRRFVNGIEPCILLDFNVDGTIINKI